MSSEVITKNDLKAIFDEIMPHQTHSETIPETLSLGGWITVGVLTQATSRLYFSIPTGRVYPEGTSITRATMGLAVRCSDSDGAGEYVVKSTSGGSSAAEFDSSQNFTFYNANNASKTVSASNIGLYFDGLTNIRVYIDGDPTATGTQYVFSGTSAINNRLNNQACSVICSNITLYFDIP